ncbi:MAG: FAD:protein FMN transferase [Campylobacteraceae bacterium]|nr:FAD:protein FMN transferase [Campylobacteraceae bacterium]
MEFYNFEFVCMTSPCSIQVYSGEYDNAKAAFEEIKKNSFYLEKKYNFYDEDSYLSKVINLRSSNEVKVDNKTSEILKSVKELSIKTNNIFDITMGTLNKSYKKDSKKEIEESLKELISKTGIDSWGINKKSLSFKYKETLIDLGGVIKEYAVDEAVKILKKHNIISAIVNFGGDLFVLGKKPNGEMFKVGIKNPKNTSENLLAVKLYNQGLTTSASYERNRIVEDEEFSHILTKSKRQKDIISSTVISSSTLKSGIYSTSFMISNNIDIPDEVNVVLIDTDLQIHHNLGE